MLVAAEFHKLRAAAENYFNGDAKALRFSRAIDMRYAGQEHTVPVVTPAELADADQPLEAFHAAHKQAYTFCLPETPAEMVTFHLAAELDTPQVRLPELRGGTDVETARLGCREVFFGEFGGWRPADVFDRELLPAGIRLNGPLLVQEPTTTTLVLPGQVLQVEQHGLLLITELS